MVKEKIGVLKIGEAVVAEIDSLVVNPPTVEEIESFILECGQENLNGFGGVKAGGIYLQQIPDELAPCIAELLKYQFEIKNYLEVGSASGGSCFVMNHFFPLEKIVLIDNNGLGRQALRNEVLKGIFHQELIGRSDDEVVYDSVAKMGIQFDLILLDSDHSYQNVRVEAALYLPFLRPGGFLFLHDTVYSKDGDGRVMRELAAYGGMELIAEYVSEKGPKLGIGLLRKGSYA
jgi:predicted O-methyltransferase YrrM